VFLRVLYSEERWIPEEWRLRVITPIDGETLLDTAYKASIQGPVIGYEEDTRSLTNGQRASSFFD